MELRQNTPLFCLLLKEAELAAGDFSLGPVREPHRLEVIQRALETDHRQLHVHQSDQNGTSPATIAFGQRHLRGQANSLIGSYTIDC